MSQIRLGVNIDHVATVRNARGENYPSPLRAAITAQKFGAHSITIHLREDRRHIIDSDLRLIKSKFLNSFFIFSARDKHNFCAFAGLLINFAHWIYFELCKPEESMK